MKETRSIQKLRACTVYLDFLETYLWILSFIRPYMPAMTGVIILEVMVAAGEMSVPQFVQYLLDYILPQHQFQWFARSFLLLIVALSFMFGAMALQNLLQRSLREKASRDLQHTMFNHLRKLGFSYYEQHPAGETLSLFNSNIPAVQQIYSQYLPQMIKEITMLVVPFSILIWMNWKLLLWVLPCYFLYYFVGPYIDKMATLYLELQTRHREALNKKIYDNISSITEVRAYGAEKWELNRFAEAYETYKNTRLTSLLYRHLRFSCRAVAIAVGLLVLYTKGAHLIRSGMMTVGELTSFSAYCMYVMNGIGRISFTMMEQTYIVRQAKHLYEFIRLQPEIVESDKPLVRDHIQGKLEFDHVFFGYPSRSDVLRGFSATIEPGQKTALVGVSGGGKSSLLKLVGRFYDPSAGVVRLDGIPLRELSLSQLRQSIGYVFQETYLFGASIADNIRFGLPEATDDEVQQAAKAAQIHDFIIELPEGYATLVGERGMRLSGGQKQRIAIARMFLKNPKIILLDEATASLDNAGEKAVQQALDTLLGGRTTLTVAHRLSTVKHYDQLIVVHEGKAAETGTYDALLVNKGLFAQLVEGERKE